MHNLQVVQIDDTHFDVTVHGASTTIHRVTLPADYAVKLTQNRATAAALVEKSFEFLLEREPNTSILRSFDLSVISRYFPEYEASIQSYF